VRDHLEGERVAVNWLSGGAALPATSSSSRNNDNRSNAW
jgi:hypothetical protein